MPNPVKGKHIKRLSDEIGELYTPAELRRLLLTRLDRRMDDLASATNFKEQRFQIVETARRRGWYFQLLDALIADSKHSRELARLAVELSGVAETLYREDPQTELDTGGLEAFVSRGSLTDYDAFLEGLLDIRRWTCSILVDGDGGESFGSGLLVGPDLVITNHHVVDGMIADPTTVDHLEFSFDYHGANASRKIKMKPTATTVVASSPPRPVAEEGRAIDAGWDADHLDYALLKLPVEIGEEPYGPARDPDDLIGPERGWCPPLERARSVKVDDPLLIAQHPNGRPLRIGFGRATAVDADQRRVRYSVNTDGGSSGSPCFNLKMRWVALHHYGSAQAGYNQGIPVSSIVADLRAKSIELPQKSED